MKKFTDFLNESQNSLIDYDEAFHNFIRGQKVETFRDVHPFGDYDLPIEERFYGYGLKMANGYSILYYGGGQSGEDYNCSFIISPDDKMIAKDEQ